MNRVKIYIFVFSYENQGAEEGGLTLGGVGLGASPGRPPITSPTDASPREVFIILDSKSGFKSLSHLNKSAT